MAENNVGSAAPVADRRGSCESLDFRAAEEGDEVREDFETHYNMGTAYKELDLMDEAIQEFQTSARLVNLAMARRDSFSVAICSAIVLFRKVCLKRLCLWFKKGLTGPGHSEDEYQALVTS